MKINVKLFSILRQRVDDYDPDRGVDIELAPHAVVADLIQHLNIPDDQKPVVTCNGRILKTTDILSDGSLLQIFQPVAGG
jgi:sulfur carrier protein ThiS